MVQRRPRPKSFHEEALELIGTLITKAESDDTLNNRAREEYTGHLLQAADSLSHSDVEPRTRRHSIGSFAPLREKKWKRKYDKGIDLSPLDESKSLGEVAPPTVTTPTGTDEDGISGKYSEESKDVSNEVLDNLVIPESETRSDTVLPSSPSSYCLSPLPCRAFCPEHSELVVSTNASIVTYTSAAEELVVMKSLSVPQSAVTELSVNDTYRIT